MNQRPEQPAESTDDAMNDRVDNIDQSFCELLIRLDTMNGAMDSEIEALEAELDAA